ncbi:MAG: 6-phosphofructokinase, partial [Firmicutes bacterium]|nr:6-phosphofructokinase [Bacillota bacterium]
EDVCSRLLRGHRRGKTHSIIIVAEGAASGFDIAQKIRDRTGFETRVTVLGHVQRGGTPSALDRTLASRMGAKAVDALAAGKTAVMVGVAGQRLELPGLDEVLSQRKELDMEVFNLAAVLAI